MKIGTSVDDGVFRNKVSEESKSGIAKYQQIKGQIDEFKNIEVNFKLKTTQEQKADAYT